MAQSDNITYALYNSTPQDSKGIYKLWDKIGGIRELP